MVKYGKIVYPALAMVFLFASFIIVYDYTNDEVISLGSREQDIERIASKKKLKHCMLSVTVGFPINEPYRTMYYRRYAMDSGKLVTMLMEDMGEGVVVKELYLSIKSGAGRKENFLDEDYWQAVDRVEID